MVQRQCREQNRTKGAPLVWTPPLLPKLPAIYQLVAWVAPKPLADDAAQRIQWGNRFLINFFPQNLFLCQTMGRSRFVSPTRGAGLPDARAHVSLQGIHLLDTCAAPTLSCRTWGQAWSQLQSEAALPLQWALGK